MTTLKSAGLEEDGDHTLLDGPLQDARAVREETKHAVVLPEHFGAEALEAAFGARANDVVEQYLAQALPLVTVLEDESDLGGRLTIRRLKTPATVSRSATRARRRR